MPTIAVHLGAHKTGTSLVQKFMRDKESQIAPFGIRAVSRSDTNTLVGWGKTLIDHPERLRSRLETEVAAPKARFVVISHENTLGRPHLPSGDYLYPEAFPRIDALAAILAGFDARVIFYLRRNASFLESYYLQLIQQGEFFTFDEWLDRVDLDRVSWAPVVGHLREAFGPANVAIGGFDEIEAGQEEFLRLFFKRVDSGIDLDPSYKVRRNPSISGKGLEIALSANRYVRSGGDRQKMRKFLQANFSNVKYPRPVLFSEEQRAEIGRRYDSEYESLVAAP